MLGCSPYVLIIGTAKIMLLRAGQIIRHAELQDECASQSLRNYCAQIPSSTFIIAFHNEQVALQLEVLPPLRRVDRLKLVIGRLQKKFDSLCGWRSLYKKEILTYGLQETAVFEKWCQILSRHICYSALLPLEASFLSHPALRGKNAVLVVETQSSGWVHYVVRNGQTVFFRLTEHADGAQFLENVVATRDYMPRLGMDKSGFAFAILCADRAVQQEMEQMLHSCGIVLDIPLNMPIADLAITNGLMKGGIKHPLHQATWFNYALAWLTPLRLAHCHVTLCCLLLLCVAGFAYDGGHALLQYRHIESVNRELGAATPAAVEPRLRQAQAHQDAFRKPAVTPAAMLQELMPVLGDGKRLSRLSWRVDDHERVSADVTVYTDKDAPPFLQQWQSQIQGYTVEDMDRGWLSSDNTDQNVSGHRISLVQR